MMYGLGAPELIAQMPILPPGSCSANQLYIPPGGKFVSGPMAGQVTSTGACQDASASSIPGNPEYMSNADISAAMNAGLAFNPYGADYIGGLYTWVNGSALRQMTAWGSGASTRFKLGLWTPVIAIGAFFLLRSK